MPRRSARWATRSSINWPLRSTSLPERPVTRDEKASSIRDALGLDRSLPESGTDPDRLVERTTQLLFDHSLFNAHPRFFGYITAPPAPIGILGDFIASALNANVGQLAALAGRDGDRSADRAVDRPAHRLRRHVRRPARERRQHGESGRASLPRAPREAPWDVRTLGTTDGSGRRLAAVRLGRDAHMDSEGGGSLRARHRRDSLDPDRRRLAHGSSRRFAARLIGIGRRATCRSWSSARPDRSAPASSTLCRPSRRSATRANLWFHVDGAYGGFAAATPDAPADLAALSLADSVAVDPHKWLYAPLEAGCALVRDPEHLRRAFAYHPPYYHFDEQVTNFVDFGPQNSRGFRALKVWLALQHAGAAGYRQMIAEDIRLSRLLADVVASHPEFELCTQSLSIATFRFVPVDRRPTVGSASTEGTSIA